MWDYYTIKCAQVAFRTCLLTCVKVQAAERIGFTGYRLLPCTFSAGSLVVSVIEASSCHFDGGCGAFMKTSKADEAKKNNEIGFLCTSQA